MCSRLVGPNVGSSRMRPSPSGATTTQQLMLYPVTRSTSARMDKLQQQNESLQRALSSLIRVSLSAVISLDRAGQDLELDPTSRAVGTVADLLQDIWDLRPDLVDARVARDFTRDLSPGVAKLGGHADPRMRDFIVRDLCHDAPPDVVDAVWKAGSLEEREEILRQWWAAVGSPNFLPLEQISRELSAERRWRRVHAAKHLREIGGPDLIDRDRGDVDPDALRRWNSGRRGPLTLLR